MSDAMDDLIRSLIVEFEAEAAERLQALNEHLLALEKEPGHEESARLLKAIFREAHTVKGSAGGLGLREVESIAHRMETLFGLYQSGQLVPAVEAFDLLYRCLDAMGGLVREAARGEASGVDVGSLCAGLETMSRGETRGAPTQVEPASAESAHAPSSSSDATPLAAAVIQQGERSRSTAQPAAGWNTELMASFHHEANQRIEAMRGHLKELEGTPGVNKVRKVLTGMLLEAGTIKGTAANLGLEQSRVLAGAIESLMARLPNQSSALRGEGLTIVSNSLDGLSRLVEEAASGVSENATRVNLEELLAGLDTLGRKPTSKAVEHAPSSPVTPAVEQKTAAPVAESEIKEKIEEPPAIAATAAPTPSPTLAVPAANASAKGVELARAAAVEETIRVSVSKLDDLMAQVGELQVTRIGTEERQDEIAALAEEIESWEARWRKLRGQCRKFLAGSLRETGVTMGGSSSTATMISGQETRTWRALAEFLLLNETHLRSVMAKVTDLKRGFQSDNRRMAQVANDLQDHVRRVRMRPISTVFELFPRMVRDIARSLGKSVNLIVEGGENEMDRTVLEQVHGPLVHLIRNCIDHGLESPEARERAGKPRGGTVRLSASQRGSSIQIDVEDDGGGIDVGRVRASAVKKGTLTAEAAEALSDREALWLIFRSGMSTKAEVTDISGRGVGLDVVRETVEHLGGIIDVETKLGQGTKFSITLPLTVATTLCLLIELGGRSYALPVNNVLRITQVKSEAMGRAGGQRMMVVDDRPLALHKLGDVLEVEVSASKDRAAQVVILGSAEKRVAFQVDSVMGTQEMVIKSLPSPMTRVRRIAGASILGSGEVVLILNVADLIRTVGGLNLSAPPRMAMAAPATPPKPQRPTHVLVVDDSFTTRTLEKNILEAAGFQVLIASDGLEAWHRLQETEVDLVVTDVNMPRMDGFELTAQIRADNRLKNLPVILVTSLDSAEDREKGIKVGADAHIVKGSFDQESLLATVRRLS